MELVIGYSWFGELPSENVDERISSFAEEAETFVDYLLDKVRTKY